jgi:hypothetical protein
MSSRRRCFQVAGVSFAVVLLVVAIILGVFLGRDDGEEKIHVNVKGMASNWGLPGGNSSFFLRICG